MGQTISPGWWRSVCVPPGALRGGEEREPHCSCDVPWQRAGAVVARRGSGTWCPGHDAPDAHPEGHDQPRPQPCERTLEDGRGLIPEVLSFYCWFNE